MLSYERSQLLLLLLASYQKLCTTYKRTRRESLKGHTCHSYLSLALYENAPNKFSIWCQADKSRKPIFFAPKYKYPDRQQKSITATNCFSFGCGEGGEEEASSKNAYVGSECKATLHSSIDHLTLKAVLFAPRAAGAEAPTTSIRTRRVFDEESTSPSRSRIGTLFNLQLRRHGLAK